MKKLCFRTGFISSLIFSILLAFGTGSLPVSAATTTYHIDFGRSTIQTKSTGWNNIIDPRAGTAVALIDSTGAATAVTTKITNSFYYYSSIDYSTNNTGTTASSLYPSTATNDSFFLGSLSGVNDTAATVVIDGLNNANTYDFRFYASRLANDGANRTTQYTIGNTTVELNATNNINSYIDIQNVVPTNGSITIAIAKKSTAMYGYLGVLDITEHSVDGVPVNTAPTANAGIDQTVTLPTSSATLTGTGIDTDGTIANYAWSFVSGPTTPTIAASAAATTSVTGLTTAGTYIFQLTVTDNQGAIGTDTITIVVQSPQSYSNTPYGGTPRSIPGTIQAEDFDEGGEGVAYHDTDATNSGNQYRTADGVDIETTSGGGYDVGWTAAGEWMKYTVDVASDGDYTLEVRASVSSGTSTVTFDLDGTTIATTALPATGGWQNWQTVSTGTVTLSHGVHTLRMYENTGGFNIDSFAFSQSTAPANTAPVANAGADQTITLPTNTITLTGSGSDTDGSIANYAWTEVSSGAATITAPASASTTVTDLGPGTYTFNLTVTDNDGATGTDTVVITVTSEPVAACSAKHIVVLGSSTASGYGLNPVSNSWVNRYASYLTGINGGNIVTNLAVGGYSTYQVLPTGSSTPNRPAPDTSHNITAALALHPDGIIVNLPSNDVANGYTTVETEANFQTIANTAAAAGVPIWFTTTQPRNLSTTQIAQQEQERDWIFTTFDTRALDFWSVVANADGTINAVYGQGDGIHLNALGHQKLFNRTTAAGIMVNLCDQPTNTAPTANAGIDQTVTLPTSSATLTGTGIDTDGTIANYAWSFVSGPTTPTIAASAAATTSVTGLTTAGTYIFQLTVTDNQGAMGSDDISVIVNPAVNQPPTVGTMITSITLTGSATDADGAITSYLWTKVSGGSATITTPSTATTTVTDLVSGSYTFRLTATDNQGATTSSDTSFTIN